MRLERRLLYQLSNHHPSSIASIPVHMISKASSSTDASSTIRFIEDCRTLGCSDLTMAPTFDVVIAVPVDRAPPEQGSWEGPCGADAQVP